VVTYRTNLSHRPIAQDPHYTAPVVYHNLVFLLVPQPETYRTRVSTQPAHAIAHTEGGL
jgi:hypothetical protein